MLATRACSAIHSSLTSFVGYVDDADVQWIKFLTNHHAIVTHMKTLPHATLARCDGDTRNKIVAGTAKAKKGL